MQNYKYLESQFKQIGIINEISAMLGWDANVNMPSGSYEPRSEQLSYLSTKAHALLVDGRLQEELAKATANSNTLDAWQKANLELMEREIAGSTALSEDLVAKLTSAGSICEVTWRKAKAENNFSIVQEKLTELVALKREEATIRSEKFGLSKYDSLLDNYDRNRRSDELDQIFDKLEKFLVPFADEVIAKQQKFRMPEMNYSISKQRRLYKNYLSKIEFDFTKGRLDKSMHPFCGGIPEDSRITTWFKNDDFISGFFGVIHEGGHSLYERNLPKSWRRQPVGHACGFTIHESQSLFVEKQIGMNKGFLRNVYYDMIHTFKGPNISEEEFIAAVSQVEKSYIRVDADEVTYPLHVIMRYRIERDLIEGKLEVKDLPERWNADFKRMFGKTPEKLSDGCLQDIHWYAGYFGYFPSYSLGAMTAAQLMTCIRSQISDVDAKIAKRDLSEILAWLKKNIHANASLYDSSGLIKHATGEVLNPEHFIQYLKTRYA